MWWRVLLLVLASTPARAGNDDSFLFGGQALLSGGALVASTEDTGAIWYNPAGLAENDRGRIELSATAGTLRVRPIGGGLVLDFPARTERTDLTSREVYVVPAALGLAKNIGDGISIGAGLFVTEQDLFNYQRSTETGDASVELDVAGAVTGTLIRYHAGGSIGVRLGPRVRAGATLFGVYEDYRELRKLFAQAELRGGLYQDSFLQRLVDARATRYGLEALAGVQADVACWQLGATVRTPRLVVHEKAATDNSVVLVATGEGAPPLEQSFVGHLKIGAEGTGWTRAPRVTVGAARRCGAVQLSAELDVRTADIGERRKRSVVNGRAGAIWDASARHRVGVGVFSDRTSAGPPVAFPEFRVDYYGFSAGWRRLNTVRLREGEKASTLRFSTTLAVRYALGLGESTTIEFDFRETPATGQIRGADDRRVDVRFHEVSLYLGSGLEF